MFRVISKTFSFVFAISLVVVFFLSNCSKTEYSIVYGISPYQDTILPIVAEKQNWYEGEGLSVKLKVLEWGDVMNSLAGGAVDVAIQNFNSFQSVYHNINQRGGDVIFYYPLFVFKGTAIMTRKEDNFKTLEEYLKIYPEDREKAITETIKQLKGKRIITTKGTEMEQIVLTALRRVGLSQSDVKITHALPADGLNAFLSGEGDFYSGGVTERTEARKNGAVELIETSDLNPPVIDGLVTTKTFAEAHPDVLLKLIKLWFKTVQWMQDDLEVRSKVVIDYLSTVSSTKYSIDEYKYTWYHTEVFPLDKEQMYNLLLDPNSNFYWKKSWDANNKFLVSEGQIPEPVSYSAFWGERVHEKLSSIASN